MEHSVNAHYLKLFLLKLNSRIQFVLYRKYWNPTDRHAKQVFAQATLAMMDAGVPIKAPVAGIAMGLIKDGDHFSILSDIQGMEDHLGDMDFKVAGTAEGVTAIQMDIKIDGIAVPFWKSPLSKHAWVVCTFLVK